MRHLLVRAAWLLLATSVMGSVRATPAEASGGATVAVGETASTAAPRLAGDLRQALSEELGTLRGVRVAESANARYVVRGSLTRLDEGSAGNLAEVRCEVSLVVANRRDGAIRFMLSGRASGRGRDANALRHDVLRAAVRGAVRPLARAL